MNWTVALSVGVPLALTILSSIVNAFVDPSKPPPKWAKILLLLVDILSWVDKSGKLTLPGVPSKAPPGLKLVPPADKGFVVLEVLWHLAIYGTLALTTAVLLGSCASARLPAYSTLTAIVISADSAQGQLPLLCEKAQDLAVSKAQSAAEARTEVKKIQDRCYAAQKAIEATSQIASAARDGVKDAAGVYAAPSDVMAWAKTALDAYANLRFVLVNLGLQLPSIGGK